MDSLPTELLLEIPHHLTSTSDLASLARTNRRLHLIINNLLYKRDATSPFPVAPFYGAENGVVNTLRHAQAAGANLGEKRLFVKPRSEYGSRWWYAQLPSLSAATQSVSLRKRRSMSAFLDGGFGASASRYWWHPLDIAAFFGHDEAVRFLVEEGTASVSRSRSRGLCEFTLPGCGRSGVELARRLESEWTVHSAMEAACCGGYREVADLLQELELVQRRQQQQQVESMRKGAVGKGPGVIDDGEGATEGSGKDSAQDGAGAGGVELVEFSYRDFVLERF